MKTLTLLLFSSLLFFGISCTDTVDIEKEKAAIIAVIEEETDAFYARDAERLNAVYPADGNATHLNAAKGGYGYTTEWDGGAQFKEFFENNPDPVENTEVKKNYRIRVYQGAAWASYDNESYDENGVLTSASKHDQFLEKQDGKWKIVYMSILRTESYDRVNKNWETSTLYHELKPENVENILTNDFIGHLNANHTWDKESHFNFISNNTSMKDTISRQIAGGNWVATAFHRTGTMEGQSVEADLMQFKRFEDGKIVEIFEYADPGQWE